MKIITIPLAALLLCLAGCASSKAEKAEPKFDAFNMSANVTVKRSGNEMIFQRGEKKQTVSAFHKLNEVKFFSAAKAPVVLAATLESGFPGWTLIVFHFSDVKSDSFAVYPDVVDPLDGKGKKCIVSEVKGISDDGKSVYIAINGKKAVFQLTDKKVIF